MLGRTHTIVARSMARVPHCTGLVAARDIRPLLDCVVHLLSPAKHARCMLAMMWKVFGQLSHTLEARAADYGLAVRATRGHSGGASVAGGELLFWV